MAEKKAKEMPALGFRGSLKTISGLIERHLDLFFNYNRRNIVAVNLEGPPGIGKTDLIAQLAEKFQAGFLDFPLIIWDQVDFRGVPYTKPGKDGMETHWAMPAELPKEGRGILFLDEFKQSYPSIQNCASRLILARKLGEYRVPENWFIILASNRDTDKAGTHKMASFLNNRVAHYEIAPNVEEWQNWAVREGIHPSIIAFMKIRPHLLHDFDPDRKAFPSPRSWAFFSELLGEVQLKDGTRTPPCKLEDVPAFATATVGEATAAEFFPFFQQTARLPSFEEIVADPKKTPVPTDPSPSYAVAVMVAMRCNEKNIDKAWEYMDRLKEEYAFLGLFTLMARADYQKIGNTNAIKKWVQAHAHLFVKQ